MNEQPVEQQAPTLDDYHNNYRELYEIAKEKLNEAVERISKTQSIIGNQINMVSMLMLLNTIILSIAFTQVLDSAVILWDYVIVFLLLLPIIPVMMFFDLAIPTLHIERPEVEMDDANLSMVSIATHTEMLEHLTSIYQETAGQTDYTAEVAQLMTQDCSSRVQWAGLATVIALFILATYLLIRPALIG